MLCFSLYKKYIFLVGFLFSMESNFLFAQDNAQLLVEAVATFHAGNTLKEPEKLIANFEKLAINNSNIQTWLPAYYLSLIYSKLSLKNNEHAEQYADKAIYWANTSLSNNANDENYCALSMAKTAKMAVNPYMRWLTYEKSIHAALEMAKKINPLNPRIYILEGTLTLKMPFIFGGGCNKAKPLFLKAQSILTKQVPQKVLPTWGNRVLSELKEGCPF